MCFFTNEVLGLHGGVHHHGRIALSFVSLTNEVIASSYESLRMRFRISDKHRLVHLSPLQSEDGCSFSHLPIFRVELPLLPSLPYRGESCFRLLDFMLLFPSIQQPYHSHGDANSAPALLELPLSQNIRDFP